MGSKFCTLVVLYINLNFANYVVKIWFQQERLSISLNSSRHSFNKSRRLLFTASLRDNFKRAADIHIRNKFHFSEVYRIMNVMGHVQSK